MGKILKYFFDPVFNGVAAAGIIAISLQKDFISYLEQGEPLYLAALKMAIPTVLAANAAGYATMFLKSFFIDPPLGKKTNLTDYLVRSKLSSQILSEKPPVINYGDTMEFSYRLSDFIKFCISDGCALEKKARFTKNPYVALDSALRYIEKEKKFDKGYVILRDSMDWFANNKPTISTYGGFVRMWHDFTAKIVPYFSVREVSNYMFLAINSSLTNPVQSWYWGKLGKAVANKFDLPGKLEMYLFHSLLATAQKRSDQNEAWKDSVEVLMKQEGERLGESRNPVWRIKSDFFANTLVFKGNESHGALEKEVKAAQTLEKILEGTAKVPQMLHLTDKNYDGLYVSLMRYAQGETLHDKIVKQDYSALPKVIEILARIHARYPTTDLPKLSVLEKTKQRIFDKDFNVPVDLANNFIQNSTPLYRALDDSIYVANKDAHDKQWQIGDYITVLDLEFLNQHHPLLDVANLLEFCDHYKPEQRKEYVRFFAQNLREQGRQINNRELAHFLEQDNLLFRVYDNSVIHRMICIASAWSSLDRKQMHVERPLALSRAIRAINDLQNDDPNYYESYNKQYSELRKSLEAMRKHVTPYIS